MQWANELGILFWGEGVKTIKGKTTDIHIDYNAITLWGLNIMQCIKFGGGEWVCFVQFQGSHQYTE
jgi:hypothetical protein